MLPSSRWGVPALAAERTIESRKNGRMSSALTPLETLEAMVMVAAEDAGVPLRDAFAQQAVGLLEEVGDLSGPEIFTPAVGAIDAVDWDEETARLSILTTDYVAGSWGSQRDRREITPVLTDAAGQLSRLLKAEGPTSGDDSARRMLSYIGDIRSDVRAIRIIAVSNGSYETNTGTLDPIEEISVDVLVCDSGDLVSLSSHSSLRDTTLDLSEHPVGGLEVLGPIGRGNLVSYMTVLPGDLIADLYQAHGARILGRNIRAFLQANNRVNKGMRDTVKQNPSAFFAFNNGLSLTATSVERGLVNGHAVLTSVKGLEVVNGGQTTASLHNAKYRDQVDLSDVFVQAKLTVLPEVGSDDIALQIAQFANSQSPVRMGDLTSNSKFFQSIEQLSRTVSFSVGGTDRLWFFERLRGQFATDAALSKMVGSEGRFHGKHDRGRKFDKASLAKIELAWLQMPAAVAAGNEKALAVFINLEHGPARGGVPDEKYYRRFVAKAILWAQTDAVIGSLALGGYKALDIAYTIALISNRTAGRFDLDTVARAQDSGDAWRAAVAQLAPLVHANLVEKAGNRNVSSWAKSGAAWDAVKFIDWVPDPSLTSYAPSSDETRVAVAESQKSIGLAADPEELAARNQVEQYGSDGWFQLSSWAKETDNLQGWQRGIAFSIGRFLSSGRSPTARQVTQAVKILSEADRLGFAPVSQRD